MVQQRGVSEDEIAILMQSEVVGTDMEIRIAQSSNRDAMPNQPLTTDWTHTHSRNIIICLKFRHYTDNSLSPTTGFQSEAHAYEFQGWEESRFTFLNEVIQPKKALVTLSSPFFRLEY